MKNCSSASDLRDAWEDFLGAFGRCIGRLISFGQKHEISRGWAHRLKNASAGDDEGLYFLREARNHVEHGLTPFADFSDSYVDIGGGFIALGGNSSVKVKNCSINGVPTGDFEVSAENGKVKRFSGSPSVPMYEVPASVRLKDVKNAENGRVAIVPKSLKGIEITSDRPDDLALIATTCLSEMVANLEAIWRQKALERIDDNVCSQNPP